MNNNKIINGFDVFLRFVKINKKTIAMLNKEIAKEFKKEFKKK